ncbi:hypothetical protein [Paenibacillus prosopidis]|uniref:Uncharacterized protein n=1 Tax=Paenibacillus prosopidis TaxID=630520 RepID=A0A368W5I2_9BACL|nr:hypothetical protein [Paenibacillus prosopidis]RCW49524.1 hypothetical protein DFP97_104182 [Paenibacillus prosopidis]
MSIFKYLKDLLFPTTGLFMVSSGPSAIPGNHFFGIYLNNPSGSKKQIYISRIIAGGNSNVSITLIRNGTFAGGTPLIPYNANFGSAKTPAATVKLITQSTDPFAGSAPFSTVIQSDGSIVIDDNGRATLPPNSSLGIRIENNTPQPNLLSATISWWEQKY